MKNRERRGREGSGRRHGALMARPESMGLIPWEGDREPPPGREKEA